MCHFDTIYFTVCNEKQCIICILDIQSAFLWWIVEVFSQSWGISLVCLDWLLHSRRNVQEGSTISGYRDPVHMTIPAALPSDLYTAQILFQKILKENFDILGYRTINFLLQC